MQTPKLLLVLAFSLVYPSLAAAKYPKRAIVTGSEIKIRDEPHSKGRYVNNLYNNMVVTALAESDLPTESDGKKNYWYKVEISDITGWHRRIQQINQSILA